MKTKPTEHNYKNVIKAGKTARILTQKRMPAGQTAGLFTKIMDKIVARLWGIYPCLTDGKQEMVEGMIISRTSNTTYEKARVTVSCLLGYGLKQFSFCTTVPISKVVWVK